MGMDLNSAEGGTRRFSQSTWSSMLKLAYLYGWKPLGTEPGGWIDPDTGPWYHPVSWDGNYTSNDLQWVTEEDAARIAEALENALEDIPDHDVGETTVEYGPKMVFTGPGVPGGLLEYFSGAGKQRVRDFVAFCRVGAFFLA